MYAIDTSLFGKKALARYLSEKLEDIKSEIASEDSVAIASVGIAERVADATIHPLALIRSKASFSSEAFGSTVRVTMTVPLDGNERLLELCPTGQRALNATIRLTDHLDWASGGRRAGSHYESEKFSAEERAALSAFSISHEFEGPTPAEVKIWGRETCNKIEALLEVSSREIENYNDKLKSTISLHLEARRRALQAVSVLDEMDKGI